MEKLFETLTQLLKTQLGAVPILAYPVTFAAGILTSFTPCVYPLIPIVVGYIGGRQEKSRRKVSFLMLFYIIGMAITYSGLGLVAALSGKLFGQLQERPLTYIIVGSIIIFFGLSMLGVWVLPLPSFLLSRKPKQAGNGLWGAFVMGLASGFVIAPCAVSVLGVLLTYVASKQSLFFGASLLFTYALGTGGFLLLLGIFTGVLSALPKPGKWTQYIQKAFGLAMILWGGYFLIHAGRHY